jgi:hypothetical protein
MDLFLLEGISSVGGQPLLAHGFAEEAFATPNTGNDHNAAHAVAMRDGVRANVTGNTVRCRDGRVLLDQQM